MGEFAVDTPSAAMPFLTTNPCGAQLCKRIKAGGLSSSRERCPVWDKQPRNKATQDTSGRDSGLRLSGENPLLRPRSLLPSFISHLQSCCLWLHFTFSRGRLGKHSLLCVASLSGCCTRELIQHMVTLMAAFKKNPPHPPPPLRLLFLSIWKPPLSYKGAFRPRLASRGFRASR